MYFSGGYMTNILLVFIFGTIGYYWVIIWYYCVLLGIFMVLSSITVYYYAVILWYSRGMYFFNIGCYLIFFVLLLDIFGFTEHTVFASCLSLVRTRGIICVYVHVYVYVQRIIFHVVARRNCSLNVRCVMLELPYTNNL